MIQTENLVYSHFKVFQGREPGILIRAGENIVERPLQEDRSRGLFYCIPHAFQVIDSTVSFQFCNRCQQLS